MVGVRRRPRAKPARAHGLVQRGLHLAQQRRADRLLTVAVAQNSFQAVAEEWRAQNTPYWSATYAGQVRTVLEADVFPHVGVRPLPDVSAAHVLAILRRVHGRGATSIAVLIRQWVSAIFRFGVATLRAEHDPAGALRRPPVQHKTAFALEPLRVLLDTVRTSGATAPVRLALQLLAVTFVRPGELRHARWAEFDLEGALWRIPAERMKMREAHLVPLSSQALALLVQLRAPASSDVYLFPNIPGVACRCRVNLGI